MPLVYSFCHIAGVLTQLQTTFASGKVQAHKVGLLENIFNVCTLQNQIFAWFNGEIYFLNFLLHIYNDYPNILYS